MNKIFCQNEESVCGGRVKKQWPGYNLGGAAIRNIITVP